MSQQSLSSPCMSDKTLLVSVEDLISLAMGRSDSNTVDFKMVQTILHILARQMRVLEQKVVLVSAEIPEPRMRGRSRGRAKSKNISGTTAGEGEREEDDEYGGERPRSSSRSGRRRQRSRDQGGGRGRRSWEDDTTTSTSADQRARADRWREMDDRAGGRGGRDDDGRGGRDRAGGGRGGSDRDDDGRGGRDRAGGGRGGSDRDDEGRGGRDRGGGGRGGSDRDDDGKGGRDRAGGGRGGSDIDDDGRGGRDRAGGGRRGSDRDDDGRGGRDKAGGGTGGLDRDDDGRGGRDRAGGGRGGSDRDHDSRGGPERDDDGRGGHDRSGGGRGGKYDDGRGGGLVGTDYDDGGRGRLDSDVGGKGGRDYDEGGKGGAGKGGKDGGGAGAISGIGIREIDGPGKEKLLVVEKGPTTIGGGRERRDSIAVVTQSQFVLLEQAVEELKQLAGPLPSPVMPDNRQLRKDVAAGASLTDTMQAMQVSARVKAAEEAIGKMGELLTQLAVSGALPPAAAGAALAGGWTRDADGEQSQQIVPAMSYKSVVIDPSEKGADDGPGSGQVGQIGAERRPATPGATSFTIHAASAKRVTEPEMADAIKMLREEMKKSLQDQIERAATAAETALNTAKGIVGKVEELLKMDSRISAMHSMVNDYTEQLNGFDAGLTTQLASFNEQMEIMRSDLAKGMAQLQVANSNPETVAVMELNERFEGLVRGLDDTLLLHTSLTNMQNQLTLELKALMEAVEELREQKADRDELVDSLRDKADNWRLEGLVTQEEFERLKTDLQQRMEKTSAKFQKQDEIWTEAIRDLTELARTKAQVMELFKLRDETTAQLRNIDERISRLALILGEPKAAMLMRKLARDAVCASCLTPAMMDPGGEPRPPLLPAARGAPPEPCVPEPTPPPQPDFRTHKCHRWVGGSHTLLPAARAHAAPLPVLPDVINKYTGYGNDGRLYWMESEMQPCVECNPEAPAPPGTERSDAGGGGGGGDGGDAGDADLLPGDFCECP